MEGDSGQVQDANQDSEMEEAATAVVHEKGFERGDPAMWLRARRGG